jgi:hypothetical protein
MMREMVFWGNSEVVGQAWIIVTAGQVSYRQTTSFSGLMSALMVPATIPVYTMGQN